LTGVRAAAVRKLPHELGIPESQLNVEDFTYLTKIHYLAPSDGIWGEHESESSLPRKEADGLVDYILFCTLDVTLEPNMNEVSDAKYVSKDELEHMFKSEDCKLPQTLQSRMKANIISKQLYTVVQAYCT
jgi:isopentenyl-diphosphate delta-isomerase